MCDVIAGLTARPDPALLSQGLALVAVIGPPGVGKSTIVAHFAAREGVAVFRLREFIRSHPDLLSDLAPADDLLGWVSLEAVRRLVHAAFVDRLFAVGHGPVVLDNFPGTAGQLALLAEIADVVGARLALLELRAWAATLVMRVAQRRVCLQCGPDSHASALPSDADSDRCARCGATLSRRASDAAERHRLRLARYCANLPEITELAAAHRIPHHSVDANLPVPDVRAAAQRAFHLLTCVTSVSADPSWSRP